MALIYDELMNGQGHVEEEQKVKCPQCGYHFFRICISNNLNAFWAECASRDCHYASEGVSGLKNLIDDRLRAVIKVKK